MNDLSLVRILLITDEYKESLLALPLGEGRYRLNNSPWFAYGISANDIVEARPKFPYEEPVFIRLLEKSGHRTVRVYLGDPLGMHQDLFAHPVLGYLLHLGCALEAASAQYFAVGIPPHVDFQAVCDYLNSTGEQWEYADPSFRQLYPQDSYNATLQ